MSCFTKWGPGKEHGTNKPPPTGRVWERSKVTPRVRPPPRILADILLGWAMHAPPGRTESEWLVRDDLETNPITVKPETASYMAELFSWVPLPYCSPSGCSFPIISLALSAHVSPQTIHFWMLDKSPLSGPGRGAPSCNTFFWLMFKRIYLFSLFCFQLPYIVIVEVSLCRQHLIEPYSFIHSSTHCFSINVLIFTFNEILLY